MSSFQTPLLTASPGPPPPLHYLLNSTGAATTSYNYTTNITTTSAPASIPIATDTASSLGWFMVSVLGASPDDSDEDTMKRWSSFIGICIAITGNVLISLALNVQKFAHMRLAKKRMALQCAPATAVDAGSEGVVTAAPGVVGHAREQEEEEEEERGDEGRDETTTLLGYHSNNGNATKKDGAKDVKQDTDTSYISSPLWWLGLMLMFFGECGNFLAYGFAPASIVSPLGVVALVSNCVIAPVMLKEPFRGRDVMGVLVSIAGAVTVVWSAEKEEVKLGPDEILSAISQPAFLIYLAVTLSLILPLLYLSRHHGHRTILIDLGLVGLFGGYTVLSTKGISSLISSSFYHIFQYPIAYIFTFVLALTAILQVKYLNRALQRFDSTQVIPTQFVLFTLSVILGSAVLYRDFEGVTRQRVTKFAFGCGLTFIGVYLISSRRNKQKSQHHYNQEYEDLESATLIHDQEDTTSVVAGESRTPSESFPHHNQQHLGFQQRPILSRAVSSAAVSETLDPALPPHPHPHQTPHPSSSMPTISSPPPRAHFPINNIISTPPSRRQSETTPASTPATGSEHAMIPGAMTGYQIGEVMRASGNLRRVTGGDAAGSAAGGNVTGGRGRKGSLSEVVMGLVRGKSTSRVRTRPTTAVEGERRREVEEVVEEVEERDADEGASASVSVSVVRDEGAEVRRDGETERMAERNVDPEVLEREWEEQELERMRSLDIDMRDRER